MSMRSIILRCIVISYGLVSGSAYAVVVFDWSFDDELSPGPVAGTITFDSLTPGVGGTDLTPDSITIDSAPGHTFASGYTLGENLIGDLERWSVGAWAESWGVAPGDVVTHGVALFVSEATPYHDRFALVPPPGMFGPRTVLATGVFGQSVHFAGPWDHPFTLGMPSFTAQAIPEPSSFLLFGIASLLVVARRKRE
jgi:hypothetical protein